MKMSKSEIFKIAHKTLHIMKAKGWQGNHQAIFAEALKRTYRLMKQHSFSFAAFARVLNRIIKEGGLSTVSTMTYTVKTIAQCDRLVFEKEYQLNKAIDQIEKGKWAGKKYFSYHKKWCAVVWEKSTYEQEY